MNNSNVINLFQKAAVVNNPMVVVPQQTEVVKEPCKFEGFKTFEVEEKELYTVDPITGVIDVIPSKKGLFVEGKNINITSDKYKVVQPNQVIETFRNTTGLKIDNIITNTNTGGLLLKSTLDNPFLSGEEHKIDLTFYTGHNGQHRTFLSLQALRMACMNQLPALSANKNLWLMNEKHYSTFNFDRLKSLIEELPLHITNFKNDYSKLHDVKVTKKQFLELFIQQFKIQTETKAGEKVINNISDVYSHAQGQSQITNDSAYKAYHALTYNLTHNGRDTANAMERGIKNNMEISHKFFDSLLQVA